MLSFRRIDIIIAQTGGPFDGNARILVCWELVTQHSGLDDTTFTIERSLSPGFADGEFDDLGDTVQGVPGQLVYDVVDLSVNLLSFWRRYFYRVRAQTPQGEVLSDVVTWETDLRTYEVEIVARHEMLLQHFTGAPAFAFVERTTGAPHCSCYDVTAGRPTDSQCTLCLGTGRQRPYFAPIPFFVDFNPDEKLVAITGFGETQPNEKDCWFARYPLVKPGDFIYEVMPAQLWRISRIGTIQPMRSTVQHVCRLHGLERREVEYRRLVQQIPEQTLKDLVQQWERTKEERMF